MNARIPKLPAVRRADGGVPRRTGRRRQRSLTSVIITITIALMWAPAASASITLRQASNAASGSESLSPTFSGSTAAGDLVTAVVVDLNSNCSTDSWSAPAGWIEAAHTCLHSGVGPMELWYYPDAPSLTSATFSCGCSTTNNVAGMQEWTGTATLAPLDQTGSNAPSTSATSLSVTTSGTLQQSNEVAFGTFQVPTGQTSISAGSGWTLIGSSTAYGIEDEYEILGSSGSTVTATASTSPSALYSGLIATFAPPPTCSGGSYGIEAPSSVTFPSVTDTGYDQNSSTSIGMTIQDETGSNDGWQLDATSTTLTSGSHTLPTTSTTFTSASTSAVFGECSAPSNTISYPVTLPAGSTEPPSVTIFSANSGTGEGPVTVTLGTSIKVTGGAYATTYASGWTVGLASGP